MVWSRPPGFWWWWDYQGCEWCSPNSWSTGQGRRNHWFTWCKGVNKANPHGCFSQKSKTPFKNSFPCICDPSTADSVGPVSLQTHLIRKLLGCELVITMAQDALTFNDPESNASQKRQGKKTIFLKTPVQLASLWTAEKFYITARLLHCTD